MIKKKYKYIYGPVSSWRLGSSLGIDPISKKRKICSFDCIYCQIGKTGLLTDKRECFVDTNDIIREIKSLPSSLTIDYITFSGRGEPTLSANLGEMIQAVKQITKQKIAVITNSSLLYKEEVQKDLLLADFIIAKLDAPRQDVLETINHPIKKINFKLILSGIKAFKEIFKSRLALQIMFIEQNKAYAKDIAEIVKKICPDEVQINTPLRPSLVSPLSKSEIDLIESYFDGLKISSPYKVKKKNIQPLSDEDTLRRRGKI